MKRTLTDDECDRLCAKTMDAIGKSRRLHAMELNPDITEHATLRRGLIRAGFNAARADRADECREAFEEWLSEPGDEYAYAENCDLARIVWGAAWNRAHGRS